MCAGPRERPFAMVRQIRGMQPNTHHRPPSALRNLLAHEAAGGLILIASAVACAGGGELAAGAHLCVGAAPRSAGPERAALDQRRADGAVLRAGRLEIKRELLDGHLASWQHRLLPGVAAIGGMLVPALIYARDQRRPRRRRCAAGRSRPRPTSRLRSACWRCSAGACRCRSRCSSPRSRSSTISAPSSIIALFYTGGLSPLMLGLAALVMAALIALNRAGVTRLVGLPRPLGAAAVVPGAAVGRACHGGGRAVRADDAVAAIARPSRCRELAAVTGWRTCCSPTCRLW